MRGPDVTKPPMGKQAMTAATAVVLALSCVAADVRDGQRERRPKEPEDTPAGPSTRITTIVENGGRLDWSAKHNMLVFDRRVGDGFFDIYTSTTSGENITCLTCDKEGLPPKSKGNPAWHPSGEYIVFQAQNTYPGLGALSKSLGRITDYAANPGAGINNDVWVMDRHGRRFWQLTEVKPRVGGVLHPHFSRSGDKLFWSERVSLKGPWGGWALRVADFVVERDEVRIANARSFRPGTQQRFYESHGFSPNNRDLLFSGNLERGQKESQGDIYLFEPESGRIRNLTQSPKEWDEHAHFSPDGKTIVWMSSKGLPGEGKKTDYWLMNADGSGKRRLTFFNTPGHPESAKGDIIAADFAWGPDGNRIAAYLITDVRTGGKIVMIEIIGGPRATR